MGRLQIVLEWFYRSQTQVREWFCYEPSTDVQPAANVAAFKWLSASLFTVISFLTISVPFASAQDLSAPQAIIQDSEKKLNQAKKSQQEPSGYLPPQGFDVPVSTGPAEGPEIKVRRVVVTGATVYSADEFLFCTQPITGRSVTEAELVGASSCITKIYQDAGYALSRAIIPPQDVPNGKLIIQVIEGYIGTYEFEGGDGARFGADKFADVITQERPLTLKTLERQLMLISDIPGIAVEDTEIAERGSMSGHFKLIIKIKSWQLFSSSEYDNRGTEDVGPYQSYSSVFLNSLFGRGESIGFGFSSAVGALDELSLGQVSVDVPLDAYGLRLSAFILASRTAPDDIRKIIDTRYKSQEFGGSLEWAHARSRERSLWFGAGFWFRSTQWETSFGDLVDEDMAGLSASLKLNQVDRFGAVNYLEVQLRQGLDVFDAARKGDALRSRFDGDGVFSKLTADYIREHSFNKEWTLRLDATLQVATSGLLSSEEFYLGGSRFGRAFDSGVLSGDSGGAISLELQYTREIDMRLLNAVQLYGFADAGQIFDDVNPVLEGAVLSSAGVGARFYFDYGITGGVEVAFPLEDEGLTDADDQEFYFRIGRQMKLENLRFDRGFSGLMGAR
ncbi:MAG: heme utilization protein [Rhodomicrobium sp.]|nr:MAG: heme utilization protein [Rhodomicrobium sp.]